MAEEAENVSGDRRPLRVALVIKTNQGGAWILPHIQALQRLGHEVTVLLPTGKGRLRIALADAGVGVRELRYGFGLRPSTKTLRGLFELRTTIRSLGPDVLFYHLYASALATRIASWRLPIRRVHMVAGPLYLESRPIRLLERLAARSDHLIIGGSDYTTLRYRQLSVPPRKLETIPYGVDTDHFVPSSPTERRAARANLGIAADTFVAVMVAYVYAPKNLVHRGFGIKGHHVLLRAWSEFIRAHPNAQLLIVGSGFDTRGEVYRNHLKNQFGTDNPERRVTWMNSVDDVRDIYAAADVSVCPSLSENHGAALESGAMGLPIVVSDAGALPETVVPERTGWVTPTGDERALTTALGRAYTCWEHRDLELFGAASRTHIEKYFSQRMAASRVAAAIVSINDRAASPPQAKH